MPDGLNQYTIGQINRIVGGQLILTVDVESPVSDLLIDSRRLVSPDHSIFFALKSPRNDGHLYIPELLDKGVRNFVISDIPDTIKHAHPSLQANIVQVDNTLTALQHLCASHRKRFSIPVIGITGSNGKTIVKEWLFQLMGRDKNMVRSPKSYNSQIGVPLSVWQLNSTHDLAVFEAGISKPGEMSRLQAIIQPDIGIFTNIGQAHDENFKTVDQKIKEKLILFKDTQTLIYCTDQVLVHQHIRDDATFADKQFFTWGNDAFCDLIISSVISHPQGTTIMAEYHKNHIEITIPFTDEASVENAIHCWAVMLYFGYDTRDIAPRMRILTPIAMRMEMKEAINHCSIINDSYSSDIKSLGIALDFLDQQKQHTGKTVILSDILQSGKKDKDLYSEIAEILSRKNVSRIIGIGPVISNQAKQFKMKKEFYPDTDSFLSGFDAASFHDETILLKGARIFEFEKISKVLQLKAHETILEINLDALIHNLNFYRSKLKPTTKVMAMVKAFSYGSGSFEIANTLQYHHADYLAVAYADEGLELRQTGITMPIMVMNPEEPGMETLIRYDLEPEIYNFRVLEQLMTAIRNSNGKNDHPVSIHIKLDTGMHRLGFEEEHLDGLVTRLKNDPLIHIQSIFSHLASSENPEHDDFTLKQIERFRMMSSKIRSAFSHKILLHILNSAGIVRFPQAQFDMVRLGISLYGVDTSNAEQRHLINVSTLKSSISQIKKVVAGEAIGYNLQGVASRDMNMAVVPIGYADGLSRRLGNGRGKLLVNGHFAPIIGNVCMDMCMIDVTDITVKEGDEVIIFGDEWPITRVAEDIGTIPYEVLTGISRRVKRVYFRE
ncbi:MAG: bifunctional UDP-N-acetylmuramoyl-tripeptide:D-alanyl-D-alanine ligase/alanine racemase [Bacteroidetes bacterium]|nr:bifunctional UDP-N-acetylmuramoyl-tripeptide:D-alanyl-D-alanine ligase/alanine racemase [Bacteroidota bacterium]